MALDNLPLAHAASRPAQTTPSPPPSPLRWIAVAAAGVVAGGLMTFWWMSRVQPGTAVPTPTTATDVPVVSNRPRRQPIDLPSLEGSDTMLAGLVSSLSKHPTLARLLATPGLVRQTTLAIVQVGDGRTPATPLTALRPASRVTIIGTASGKIDPKSYARWDNAASALASIPAGDAAQLYVNVKPLFDQAYIELGHPGGDFDRAIVQAIQVLAETPMPADDPVLLRKPGYFEHQAPELVGLRPVQKQFLLIGTDNRRRVLAWMRQFAGNLELRLE